MDTAKRKLSLPEPDPKRQKITHNYVDEDEIELPKDIYSIVVEMKASNDAPTFIYRGSCGLKQDESGFAWFFIKSPEGYYLQAFCYVEAGVIYYSSPKWPKRGHVELKVLREDSIYCQKRTTFEFNNENKLEIKCGRTSEVNFQFLNHKLQSVNIKLIEDYEEMYSKFKVLLYPQIKIPSINESDKDDDFNPDVCDIITGNDDFTPPNSPTNVIDIVTPLGDEKKINPVEKSTSDSELSEIGSQTHPFSIDSSDIEMEDESYENNDNDNHSDDNEDKIDSVTQDNFENTTDDELHQHANDQSKEDHGESTKNDEDDVEIMKNNENELIFTPYVPRGKIHCVHPAKIVESTTLAGAELPPLNYSVNLPRICLKNGHRSAISSVQLETVKFVGLRHERILENKERAGYFIGDGTGVGKGRQIAAIIADNYFKGRKKAIWITSSSSLLHDCRRDMKDIGAAKIKIITLPPIGQSIPNEGCLFVTYSLLVSKSTKHAGITRFDQIMNWICDNKEENKKLFSGPLIFDEAHFAKTLKLEGNKSSESSSLTGKLVNNIQIELPNARVVYVSATGASDPRHMAYMRRLGLWGKGSSFNTFKEFIDSIGDSVGAMEMVAMEMKSLGMYCSRHLSYEGTKFELEKITLTQENKTMYDKSVLWWQKLIKYYIDAYKNRNLFGESFKNSENKNNKKEIKNPTKIALAVLWSAHQRFFLNLCISLKVDKCIEIVNEALFDNYSVVIGLFSTGESSLEETLSKSTQHEDLLSAPYLLAETFIKKWFPIYTFENTNLLSSNNNNNNTISLCDDDDDNDDDDINLSPPSMLYNKPFFEDKQMKNIYLELLSELKEIILPKNPLDEIIHSLGGKSKVSEITGRVNRLIYSTSSSDFTVSKRNPRIDNNNECKAFMSGKKQIAIISEAASTGISLHASNSCNNKNRRMHIILQLPWSAEKAIQQLGRTHRSDQSSPPFYKLLITELGGERRLASVVASRLSSLGALTSGDRRATTASDTLSEFVISPKYGGLVIKNYKTQLDKEELNTKLNNKNEISFVNDDQFIQVLKKANLIGALSNASSKNQEVKKFLNRLLGLSVKDQFVLFSDFVEKYDNLIYKAQIDGSFDDGVYDIGGDVVSTKEIIYVHPRNSNQKTFSLEIAVSKGIDWTESLSLLKKSESIRELNDKNHEKSQFYIPNGYYENKRNHHIILALQIKDEPKKYHIVRPNIGHQTMPRYNKELKRNYKKLSLSMARERWSDKYNKEVKGKNSQGKDLFGIITGSILPTCQILKKYFDISRLCIVRALCNFGNGKSERVVGILVACDKLNLLKEGLRKHSIENYSEYQFEKLLKHLPSNYVQRGEEAIKKIPMPALQSFLFQQNSKISIEQVVESVTCYLEREAELYNILTEVFPAHQKFIYDNWPSYSNSETIKQYLIGYSPISLNEAVEYFSQIYSKTL